MKVCIHGGDSAAGVEDGSVAHDRSPANSNVGQLELPIVVIDLEDFTVRAVSDAALELLGKSSGDVIGRPASDLLAPDERRKCEAALETLRAGIIDFYRTRRYPATPGGSNGPLTVWARAVQLGGERLALVELASGGEPQPSPLVQHLGREPLEMAIGTADASWVVTSMSSDVETLLGVPPADIVGRPMLGAVRHDDVPRLLDADRQWHQAQSVSLRVEMRNGLGEWQRVCIVLASLAGTTDRYFILLSDEAAAAEDAASASSLEHHLWRIAAEVEASGILQRIGSVPNSARLRQMGTLSARQWDVLSRLLRGDRVPTIAKELFVSQSTIRDHLSALFERFGVHSQAELLAAVRDIDETTG